MVAILTMGVSLESFKAFGVARQAREDGLQDVVANCLPLRSLQDEAEVCQQVAQVIGPEGLPLR